MAICKEQNCLEYKKKVFQNLHTHCCGEPFLRDLIYSDQRCFSDMGSKALDVQFSLSAWSQAFHCLYPLNYTCLPLSSVSDSCESDLTIQTTLLTHWVLDNLDSTNQIFFYETWIWNSNKLRERKSFNTIHLPLQLIWSLCVYACAW